MKKVLYYLLALVMILPLTVKADLIYVNSFFNNNVSVGEEVVVNTMINFEYFPHQIDYTYDSSMLSITKDSITTPGSSDTVKIENGKVTIVIHESAPLGSYGYDSVRLVFKALKSGTTEIVPFLGDGYSSVPGNLTINVKNTVINNKEEKEQVPNEPTKQEESTETTKTNESEKTTGSTDVDDNKKESSNNIPLYISLGANVVLLVSTIALLLKGKNNKVQNQNQE